MRGIITGEIPLSLTENPVVSNDIRTVCKRYIKYLMEYPSLASEVDNERIVDTVVVPLLQQRDLIFDCLHTDIDIT